MLNPKYERIIDVVQLVMPDGSFYLGELIVSFAEENQLILENVLVFESVTLEQDLENSKINYINLLNRRYYYRPYTDSVFPRIPLKKDFFLTMHPANFQMRCIYFYLIQKEEVSTYARRCVVDESYLDDNELNRIGVFNIKKQIKLLNKLYYGQ